MNESYRRSLEVLRTLLHRHCYWRLVPGAVMDTRTGVVLQLSKLYCNCGAEDPGVDRLAKACELVRLPFH